MKSNTYLDTKSEIEMAVVVNFSQLEVNNTCEGFMEKGEASIVVGYYD